MGYMKFAKLHNSSGINQAYSQVLTLNTVSSSVVVWKCFCNTIFCNTYLCKVKFYEYLNITKHPTKRNNKRWGNIQIQTCFHSNEKLEILEIPEAIINECRLLKWEPGVSAKTWFKKKKALKCHRLWLRSQEECRSTEFNPSEKKWVELSVDGVIE